MAVEFPPSPPQEVQTCYRHGDRRAGVTCQRCDRPICPSCMLQASVGFHCPECARMGRQRVYTARTLPSAMGRPIVTISLIPVNVAVFAIGLASTADDAFAGRTGWALDGGLYADAVADGEWWRIITAGFLHAGLMHLAFNMLALWFLGSQLEPAIGRLRFAVVYATSLFAGSLGVLLVSPDQLTVGASGAIFGMLGFAVAAQRSRGIDIWQSGLGGVLVVNLLFTFGVPGISIGGHIGGLIGGLVCGVVLYDLGPRITKTVGLAAVIALGTACAVGSVAVASAVA